MKNRYDECDASQNDRLGQLLQAVGKVMAEEGLSMGAALDGGSDKEILTNLTDTGMEKDEASEALDAFRPILQSGFKSTEYTQ